MKKILIVSVLAVIGLSTAAFANGGLPYAPVAADNPINHFEVIGALGIANLWSTGDNKLGVTSQQIDTLMQTNRNDWETFSAQLGLGYVYYFSNEPYSGEIQWFPSITPQLNFYYLGGNPALKGDVWEFGSADFNDLTYEASIKYSMRLMFDVALTVVSLDQLSFYAKGGIGAAWNRMDYSDTDNAGGCDLQRLNLNANSRLNFAWEVGCGLNFAFNDRVGLSLEYLYTDLGKARSSSSGDTGTIIQPVIVPPNFKLKVQTVALGLHVAL